MKPMALRDQATELQINICYKVMEGIEYRRIYLIAFHTD